MLPLLYFCIKHTAMRSLGIIAFLIAIPLMLQGQNYRVIKVNGQIIYVQTGQSMNQGDEFEQEENLSFGSPSSRAAVINPEKGRYILTSGNYEDFSTGKSNFLPAINNLSTRGGAINNIIDLQNEFSDAMVLLNRATYHINPYRFPMDEENFFFIRYTYNDEEINKKLPFEDKTLIIDKSNLLTVDNAFIEKPDDPVMKLFYLKKENPTYISEFQLVQPDRAALKEEAGILLDELEGEPYNRKVNEVISHIIDFYGKPDNDDVIGWLEKEFGLAKED